MGTYLKTAFMRDMEWKLTKGEISYGKMLELVEEEIIKNYNNRTMKRFEDLKFKSHPSHVGDGIQARITFDNGYGASVVKTPYSYGGSEGLYELAVFGKDGHITYDTEITSDVLGYLSKEEVSKIMELIQTLK